MLHGVQQVVDRNAGCEDLNHKNHDENQHAPAGAYSLRPNERQAQSPLTRRRPRRWRPLDIFRIRGAFSLPIKTVHGVPWLTAVARAGKWRASHGRVDSIENAQPTDIHNAANGDRSGEVLNLALPVGKRRPRRKARAVWIS